MTFTGGTSDGGTSTGGTSTDDGQELTGLFDDVPPGIDTSEISETVEDAEQDAAVAEADSTQPADPVDGAPQVSFTAAQPFMFAGETVTVDAAAAVATTSAATSPRRSASSPRVRVCRSAGSSLATGTGAIRSGSGSA